LAALFAILRALGRAVRRDLGTFQSITGNNFFLFAVVLLQQPESAEFLLLILGVILLFPLSADPLAKIPPERLALWPLSRGQRYGLRLASIAFSPVTWFTILLLLKNARWLWAAAFLATALAIQVLTILSRQVTRRAPQWHVFLRIPNLPGPLGGLIRNNIREMLSVLDSYIALVLCVGGVAYRFLSPHPDPSAFAVLSLVVALSLSTYAQCLFGLDLVSGMTRYRLLPLRGWQILLTKDMAFLGVLFVLVIPLDPWAGLTSGLAALAIGHHPSILVYLPQKRWRFTGGTLLPTGFVQAIAGTALGFAEHQQGIAFLALGLAVYLLSLFYYGRVWDRQDLSHPVE
jgi:hypothetical protein